MCIRDSSLFVSGCTNRCPHCFQPQTWDFEYGQSFTHETEELLLRLLEPAHINGLTLLGGEPFEPANQRALLPFVQRVRERFPGKTVWAFTGFTLEELQREGSYPRCEATDGLLALLDVLVDGRFEEEKKDISLRFRGSSNPVSYTHLDVYKRQLGQAAAYQAVPPFDDFLLPVV